MQITSHQAQAVIDGAAAKALELGLPVIVAVLDAGAHLKAFRRMDGAVLGSIDVAIRKARTAVLFQANSEAVWDYCKPGAPAPASRTEQRRARAVCRRHPAARRATAAVIGAVGVSGGTVAQDLEIAQAAAGGAPAAIHATDLNPTEGVSHVQDHPHHRCRLGLRQGRRHRHGEERPQRHRHGASLARRSRRCARRRRRSASTTSASSVSTSPTRTTSRRRSPGTSTCCGTMPAWVKRDRSGRSRSISCARTTR